MKLFLHTLGCKANQYETELIRARVERGGGRAVRDPSHADVCVVNTCSVTATADKESRQIIRRCLRVNPKSRVIVTGCYATRAAQELRSISSRVEVYSNQEKEDLSACLGFAGERMKGLTAYASRSRAFVKIQDGCNAPCKYCIIPTVRPVLSSKPVNDVLTEVEALVRQGHGEVVLTGIRLGLYKGMQKSGDSASRVEGKRSAGGAEACGLNLTGLLKKLNELPGKFRIRLSSLEVTEVSDDLLKLAGSSRKICRHFHVPMQSADDGVLRAMGRWYSFDDYRRRIKKIRKYLPDCAVTADVMVGYPAETEAAFERGFDRIARLGLAELHVFRFSPRPGTPAAGLRPLSPQTVRCRAAKLLALSEKINIEFRRRFAGTVRQVLAEPSGQGWTDNYIRVEILKRAKPGQLVPVKI